MKKACFAILMILVVCITRQTQARAETGQKKSSGKIAFCQHDGKYWQIWIMNLDGSNKKKLTDSRVDKRHPDLSGDGKRIVYTTNEGELWIVDSDGKNKTHIPLNVNVAEPKWCFQDKKIVFASYQGISFLDDSDIWLVNSDGLNLKKLTRRPSLQFLPDISEDAKEIVFVDVLESAGHEIFKLNLETNDYIQLTDNRYHDTNPSSTADGNQIAFSSDRDGSYDIWIMDRFGQNQKNLTLRAAFDFSPVITKDGETIFFLSDSTKSMQIWSVDINGKSLKQLTNDRYDKQDISVYTP